MSKKRKANSKNPSRSIKSIQSPVSLTLDAYISANRSAELTSGEELRELLAGLIYSKSAMLNYITSIGLSGEPFRQIYDELRDVELALIQLPSGGLKYLKSLLIDGTKLKQALDIASKLIDLDVQEDYELLLH